MTGALTLYRSSIGKKAIMAVSGLIGIGFLVLHMYGNLKIFEGPEYFNSYAAGLRSLGAPIFGHLSELAGAPHPYGLAHLNDIDWTSRSFGLHRLGRPTHLGHPMNAILSVKYVISKTNFRHHGTEGADALITYEIAPG